MIRHHLLMRLVQPDLQDIHQHPPPFGHTPCFLVILPVHHPPLHLVPPYCRPATGKLQLPD